MHLNRSFGVVALNVWRRSSVRKLYTTPNVWQRVTLALQNPRRSNHIPEFENVRQQREKVEQEEMAFVNKADECNRRQMQSTEPQALEENLNASRVELKVRDTLKKNKKKSLELETYDENRNKSFMQHKTSTTLPHSDALDFETLNVLKLFSSKAQSSKVYDSKRELEYLKLKQSDSLFGDLRLLVKSRKRRELKCKMILEGKRLIMDGIKAGLSMDIIVFSDVNKLDDLEIDKSAQVIQVERHVMQEWSNLTTCPGVIGIFRRPKDMSKITIRNQTASPLPITVVCDNIREPNNLGSIIRSSAAIPVKRVILLKGCTCPWDPKCLRGGAGAQFRTPISGPLAMEELDEFVPPNATFLVADNKTSDNGGKFSFCRYDAANYHEMQHVVLFIGGETFGISNDVRRFITDFTEKSQDDNSACYNIHIPLANGIESLNTASALSVLLCEIRRQLGTEE